jgi:hypothetical protein
LTRREFLGRRRLDARDFTVFNRNRGGGIGRPLVVLESGFDIRGGHARIDLDGDGLTIAKPEDP